MHRPLHPRGTRANSRVPRSRGGYIHGARIYTRARARACVCDTCGCIVTLAGRFRRRKLKTEPGASVEDDSAIYS